VVQARSASKVSVLVRSDTLKIDDNKTAFSRRRCHL
jgi:hypothetical protein